MDKKTTLQHEVPNAGQGSPDIEAALKISIDLCYENAQQLIEAVRSRLSRSPERVTLDLAEVRAMDSSGLRALIQAGRLCEEAGTVLELGSVSECAARVIRMSGLGELFGLEQLSVRVEPAQAPAVIHPVFTGWKTYEHVVDSHPSLISVLREKAAEAAIEAGVDGEVLCDIRIAVGEALTNAYKHGSPNKGEDKISLRCMTCPEALVVEIRDEGKPFDPSANCRPDPGKMRDHGMGIFLMKQAMDVVEFRSNCPGNRVRMIKWLRPDAADRD